jgi:conjugal transfer pilus assembly protein TrbC
MLLASQVSAQQAASTPRWPTAAEIERAAGQRPMPGLDAGLPTPRPMPRLVIDPARPEPAIEIEALARQGASLTTARTASATASATLRVFVTLAMPRASLQRLIDQAERSGATLVLRGLRNQSMRQTLAEVSALLGTRRVAWQIDPQAFEQHDVQVAPTFVLTLSNKGEGSPSCTATTCAVTAPFVAVAGDVSLDYALDHLARRNPQAAGAAAPHLARLRSR